VVQERNSDLQSRLSQASSEIDQLSLWISKLESASREGDAFSELKRELENAQAQVASLQEELSAKQGKSYW
jgi:predicted RNase H-like nuclease (RuvC/YqgF family)